MKVSTKHSKEFAGILTRFLGGLNKTMPPHAIEDEQLIDATNWFYDPATGYLTTREGLKRFSSSALAGEVDGVFEYVDAVGTIKTLVTTSEAPQKLYYMNGAEPVFIGNLTGIKRPSFAVINGVCIIASGGRLQAYDGANLKEITVANGYSADAPVLDFITDASARNAARIVGCGNAAYRDRMNLSGINDGTYWVQNASPDTDAKYIDAGYRDGLALVGIGMFQGDAILFKRTESGSHRALYRAVINGESANWSCPQYRRLHSALSPHLIREVGDGLLFVDTEGPKMLTLAQLPTTDIPYDISPAARPIAGEMAKVASLDGFMIIDPVKMIAMVKPQKNHEFFYCMDFFGKRWTYFRYGVNIQSGAYVGGRMLFGGADGWLYEYDPNVYTDAGTAYTMTAESKWFNIFPLMEELVKEKYVDLVGLSDGSGTITVKVKGALSYSVPFAFTQGWWDWDVVNALAPEEWTEELQKTPIYEIEDTEDVEGDFMSISISISTGRCSLSHLAARIAATRRNTA